MRHCSSRSAKNATGTTNPSDTLSRVTDGFRQTAHWGAFFARQGTAGVVVEPHPDDPAPSPLLANFSAALGPSRVESPAIRAGWLKHGPGYDRGRRGADEFVAVSWDEAVGLLSGELRRVYAEIGAEAVYGGSYGWASAGRFHHAQSQLHRFLNLCGGYVGARNTYSTGASTVILPHVLGIGATAWQAATTRQVILDHTRLVLAFGGLPLKNSQIAAGGLTRHETPGFVQAMRDRGIEVVLVSPIRDDAPDGLGGQWLPVRPGTDVAVMLGIAYTLISEGLYDAEFVKHYTVGFERFRAYVLGITDGVPKDPDWAQQISDVSASTIADLARRAARTRTLVTCTFSVQRAKHGEQPVWMAVVLAALLGQIGLPGGGFGHGYACFGNIGSRLLAVPPPGLPRLTNPVSAYIPVARVADMLLAPGEEFAYDGHVLRYPRIELVYWCGGNPFHHHQDLGRLRRAFAQPATVVVHDPFWTAMAKHADIVIPSTTTLERNDIFASHSDPRLSKMQRVVDPLSDARNDYDTFCLLSDALGFGSRFSEGRSEMEWLRALYQTCRTAWGERGHEMPSFEEFWEVGEVELPDSDEPVVQFEEFRHDPVASPLATPSGRIEIFSETIASFGYDDCPGHPAWLDSRVTRSWSSAAGRDLVLVANNPATRLHSQLDGGKASQASKIHGREPIRISRADAAERGIETGDVVRVHNDRGSCLAGAVVSDDVRRGVLQLSTGSWFDPIESADGLPFCVHGNPNVLTDDEGTSRLAQGCTGQLAVVQLERFDGELPAIRAFDPPTLHHPTGENA